MGNESLGNGAASDSPDSSVLSEMPGDFYDFRAQQDAELGVDESDGNGEKTGDTEIIGEEVNEVENIEKERREKIESCVDSVVRQLCSRVADNGESDDNKTIPTKAAFFGARQEVLREKISAIVEMCKGSVNDVIRFIERDVKETGGETADRLVDFARIGAISETEDLDSANVGLGQEHTIWDVFPDSVLSHSNRPGRWEKLDWRTPKTLDLVITGISAVVDAVPDSLERLYERQYGDRLSRTEKVDKILTAMTGWSSPPLEAPLE